MDRGLLVGCFLEAEARCESLVVMWREPERKAFARGAAGVEVQQLGSSVSNLFGRLAFGLVPLS